MSLPQAGTEERYVKAPCRLVLPGHHRPDLAFSLTCLAYPIRANPSTDDLPTQSILSPYQLSFGAICGVCAGIFVKKGAKFVAFTFGAVYVLMQVSPVSSASPARNPGPLCRCHYTDQRPSIVPLHSSTFSGVPQYFSSRSIININWNKLGSRYDALFGSKTAEGKVAAPTVEGVGRWIVDFMTANFQRESHYPATPPFLAS